MTCINQINDCCECLSPQIIVLDDEEDILLGMQLLLRNHGLGPVKTVSDSRELLPLLNQSCTSVLLMDLKMPHISGEELLPLVTKHHPHIPVILITATQDVCTAVECMKNGAFDYLLKPINVQTLISTVRKAKETVDLRRQVNNLKEYLLGNQLKQPDIFTNIITRNQKMQAIFKYMESIARTGEPFLIIGETGTGKELFAQAFHALRQSVGPMISVNVAGLDDHMFADTLFGHTKGAFTGALQMREGLVAKAAGGTLFLDEIGDLSESSQIKLLRLLQEKKYESIGSDVSKNANVIIVAATNRELKQRIHEGKFRADLYYRLATHAVVIPPLRERKEDIPLLLEKFIHEAAQAIGLQRIPTVSLQLVNLLECHDFPGNVRELRAMVLDAVANHKSGTLSLEMFRQAMGSDLMKPLQQKCSTTALLSWEEGCKPPTLREAEEFLIAHALRTSKGNQGVAATILGLSRQALNQRLARRQNSPTKY
ncbi:MAG: sigma-54-dependent Fis family transcriptional regulator [Magnetococcales bacterium]|nr:sigma-54-dependent Fis family transcriptional regulator [Magnetococcales bacterium]